MLEATNLLFKSETSWEFTDASLAGWLGAECTEVGSAFLGGIASVVDFYWIRASLASMSLASFGFSLLSPLAKMFFAWEGFDTI